MDIDLLCNRHQLLILLNYFAQLGENIQNVSMLQNDQESICISFMQLTISILYSNKSQNSKYRICKDITRNTVSFNI